MGWISDECLDKLCGLVTGTLLIGGGLAGIDLGDGGAEVVGGAVGLTATVLRRRGKDPQAVYARARKAIARAVAARAGAGPADWRGDPEAAAALERLAELADRIMFEGEDLVAAGLRAEGVVRFLMLRVAEVQPLFHPDRGHPTWRGLLEVALRTTFDTLKADTGFWDSIRPDIDAAQLQRLNRLLDEQATIQRTLDGVVARLDVLTADLRWTAEEKQRLAVELARVQSEHSSTRSLVLGFLETVLKRQVPDDRITVELFALASDFASARAAVRALSFSKNLTPELAAMKASAEAAFAAAEIEGTEKIAEALRLMEAIERKEEEAIAQLDAATADMDERRRRLDREQAEVAAERGLRISGLIETLRTKLAVHRARLDARASAETIVRIVDLEHADPESRHHALRAVQNENYVEGRDRGTRLPLEISIALARIGLAQARNPAARGAMLVDFGIALGTLGRWEAGTARLEEAVVAFRAALEEYTRERVPLEWATTQNNLGNALAILGEREAGTARLKEAVVAYRAALEEWTRERVPLDWAGTQNNLGNALATLGEREAGTVRLEEAVVAYRAALEEWTRERAPLDWAMTQNNLGTALGALGEREAGTTRLEEAVVAFRAALEERTRERVPLGWAGTQNNLGVALRTLGEREAGTARLEEAVVAFRAALEEYTRERAPFLWVHIKENLAIAHRALFQRTKSKGDLDGALAAVDEALEVYREAQAPYDIETATALRERLLAARDGPPPGDGK